MSKLEKWTRVQVRHGAIATVDRSKVLVLSLDLIK
jgi:hypothetical protein